VAKARKIKRGMPRNRKNLAKSLKRIQQNEAVLKNIKEQGNHEQIH
jgi:hypothetical protein